MADYNSQIVTNNGYLQAILEVLQNKAAGGGSGGGFETCQGTIDYLPGERFPMHVKVYRVNENGALVTDLITSPETVVLEKNSIVVMYGISSSSNTVGDATTLFHQSGFLTLFVFGDFAVYLSEV